MTADNVFPLPPRRLPQRETDERREREAMLGMRQHREWWDENRDRLDWRPISSFVKAIGGAAYATAYVLRAGDDWTYGSWIDDGWQRWTEGATWELSGFHPTEWAEVDLDDAILLGQE